MSETTEPRKSWNPWAAEPPKVTPPPAVEKEEVPDAVAVHDSFNNIKRDDGTPPDTFTMGQAMTHFMLCTFCRKEYSGKPKECPHCHRRFPTPPDGLVHIV